MDENLRKNRRYTLMVFAAFFLYSAINTSHSLLLSEQIEDFALTGSAQGGPGSIQNLGSFLALVLVMALIGRVRKPLLFVVTFAAMGAALLPMSMAGNYSVFTLSCAMMGIAMAFVDTLCSSQIADMYRGDKAARMLCVLHAIFGIGSITSAGLIGLAQQSGVRWNRVYAFWGILSLAMAAALIFPSILQMKRTDLPRESRAGFTKTDVKLLLGSPTRRMLFGIGFFYGIAFGGLTTWLGRYVETGLGGQMGALSMILLWAGLTVSRLSSSLLRIHPISYVKAAAMLASGVIAIGIFSGSAPMMGGCAFCFMLVSGSVVPMVLGYLCSGFEGNSLIATTVVLGISYISQAIGPALIGFVDSLLGMRAGMSVIIVFMALCAITAAVAEKKAKAEQGRPE